MSFVGELKRYLDADTLCRMYYCGDHEVFEFYKECDKAAEAALPSASAEITEWKEDVIYQLLEKVTVLDEARIKVTFRSGVEIEQALEKDERSVTT